MPQVVQKKSYDSVTVFWLDREAAVEAVRDAAVKLKCSDSKVSRIVLFGSLAAGNATAASDADVLLVLNSCDAGLLDRAGVFLPHFASVGLPVELFVYTEDEISRGISSIAEHALAVGIGLA